MNDTRSEPLAVLWQLQWNDNRLLCAVYRSASGLQLRVESAMAVIVDEPFVIEPRALARAHMLRDDLIRRGWSDGGHNGGRSTGANDHQRDG